MPTISRFFGYARNAEGQAKVRIDNLEVIESTLSGASCVSFWRGGELHRDELAENWRCARAGEKLQEIEPLR